MTNINQWFYDNTGISLAMIMTIAIVGLVALFIWKKR